MAYKCQNAHWCRFGGEYHDSRVCAEKIKKSIKIASKCCNCGVAHNANTVLCVKRPQLVPPKSKDSTTNILPRYPTEAPKEIVWAKKDEGRGTETTAGEYQCHCRFAQRN